MRHTILVILLVPLSTAYIQYSKEFFTNIITNLTSSITPRCQQQFEELIANLNSNKTLWAHQMVDAYSRVPKGLVTLKFEDMGDFSKCIRVDGKYCLGYVSVSNESSLLITETVSFVRPVWAMCLPNGCSTEDSNVIGNEVLTSLLQDEGIGVSFSDLLCQTRKEADPEFTLQAIVVLVVLALLILVVVVSTLYDCHCTFYRSNSCCSIVKAFSAYTNGKTIFKMTASRSSHLSCLNGLRFISMISVVLMHQCLIPLSHSKTNTNELIHWPGKLHSFLILNGDLSIDTFLTIGGTLMSYSFMNFKHNNFSINLLQYYIHRYLRLTSSLAIVVLVSATLLTYMGSGPKWPFFTHHLQENCEMNWWVTLLYVQNYVSPQKMTWYLNVDMQLYVLSPFVFHLLWNYPKWSLVLLGLGAWVSMSAVFYEVWEHSLPGTTYGLYSSRTRDFRSYYHLLTHMRASTWIFGVLLGYFLYRIQHGAHKFKLHRYLNCFVWFLCFGVLFACLLVGRLIFLNQEKDILANAFYATLVRPAWSLAIVWIVLACTNNYGGPVNWFLSLPIYQVLNRFGYSVYLTHVTLLYGIVFSSKWPEYISEFDTVYTFWATFCFSFGFAILLVFIAESPVIALETMLFGSAMDKLNQPNSDREEGTDNTAFENSTRTSVTHAQSTKHNNPQYQI